VTSGSSIYSGGPVKIMPPKPIQSSGIWGPTIMDWLAEHPKAEGPPALAD
jgi:hypothetical protein